MDLFRSFCALLPCATLQDTEWWTSNMTELHHWHWIAPGLLFQALLHVSNFTQSSSAVESRSCKFSFEMRRRCRLGSLCWLRFLAASKGLSALPWLLGEWLALCCGTLELRSLRGSWSHTFHTGKLCRIQQAFEESAFFELIWFGLGFFSLFCISYIRSITLGFFLGFPIKLDAFQINFVPTSIGIFLPRLYPTHN